MWIKSVSQVTHSFSFCNRCSLLCVLIQGHASKAVILLQPPMGHKRLEWSKHRNTWIPYTLVLYFLNLSTWALIGIILLKNTPQVWRSGLTGIWTIIFTVSYQLPEQQPHVWQACHVAKMSLSRLKERSCNYSLNLTVVFLPWPNWVDITCRDNGFLMLFCPSSAFDKNIASTQ